MKIEEFAKILEEQNGNGTHKVFIPSLNDHKQFKYLTVADLKTLSKTLLDGDSDVSYLALTTLILSNCVEKLDISELTEYDRTAILLTLRGYNFEDDEYTIQCPQCQTEFNLKIDIEGMVKRIKATKKFELVCKNNGIEFKFVLGDPSIKTVLEFKEFIKVSSDMKETEDGIGFNKEENERFEDFMTSFSQMNYIKKIEINGNEVEGFTALNFVDRFKLIDKLPTKIFGALNEKIAEIDQEQDILEVIKTDIKCINPECKHESNFFVDVEDFFTN